MTFDNGLVLQVKQSNITIKLKRIQVKPGSSIHITAGLTNCDIFLFDTNKSFERGGGEIDLIQLHTVYLVEFT